MTLICDEQPMNFYLGIHRPAWLQLVPRQVPVFVSHAVLSTRVKIPRTEIGHLRAAIDSGAFSEIDKHGRFRTSEEEYVDALITYDEAFDSIDWAAPQDWMCEPWMVAKTGLSVLEHQRRTVDNFVRLEAMWSQRGGGGDCPIMPVIQGWTLAEYVRCVEMYEEAGVRLAQDYPVVGVGSVCRRQATLQAGPIFKELASYDLPLHGFGVKTLGLERFGQYLTTADSMAWSRDARYNPPGCEGRKHCGNCLHYALDWRERLLAKLVPVDARRGLALAA